MMTEDVNGSAADDDDDAGRNGYGKLSSEQFLPQFGLFLPKSKLKCSNSSSKSSSQMPRGKSESHKTSDRYFETKISYLQFLLKRGIFFKQKPTK